ncbi:hypothetical protein PIB30_097427 [Stylosanthes scabra]|uniref:Uncharacterized protein n=1 Tax=Stylosanthes scabra TaxID=79078 RepID=A0ABU6XU78_9FABA|nr:hypothetical protein [Stylosanthes scabra]
MLLVQHCKAAWAALASNNCCLPGASNFASNFFYLWPFFMNPLLPMPSLAFSMHLSIPKNLNYTSKHIKKLKGEEKEEVTKPNENNAIVIRGAAQPLQFRETPSNAERNRHQQWCRGRRHHVRDGGGCRSGLNKVDRLLNHSTDRYSANIDL